MSLKKYTPEQVKQEAVLFLSGKSIRVISRELSIPRSTVSWHLIHPLKQIDYSKWVTIRTKLYKYAKSRERAEDEAQHLFEHDYFEGRSIDGCQSGL